MFITTFLLRELERYPGIVLFFIIIKKVFFFILKLFNLYTELFSFLSMWRDIRTQIGNLFLLIKIVYELM